MFINKNVLIAGAFMALAGLASAATGTYKYVDVSNKLDNDKGSPMILKPGVIYDVASAPSQDSTIYIDCPTNKKGTSKKAFVSYFSGSWPQGNSFFLYNPEDIWVGTLNCQATDNISGSLLAVSCVNGVLTALGATIS